MGYLCVSFTYKNYGVSFREKLYLGKKSNLDSFYENIISCKGIHEAVVLSTCNRFEVIVVSKNIDDSIEDIFNEISSYSATPKSKLKDKADIYKDSSFVHHLFSVCSSLDSLVVGETQIVGQIRDALSYACNSGFCNKELSDVINDAFRCSADVRENTLISKSSVSVASIAVLKAKELLGGSLEGITSLVVGCGDMSTLVSKHLLKSGSKLIMFVRNESNALGFLKEYPKRVKIVNIKSIKDYINDYRVLFSATSANGFVIKSDIIKSSKFSRYWFDLALPRDIEASKHQNINLFTIDGLEDIAKANVMLRESQIRLAFSIVGRRTLEFVQKQDIYLSSNPIIKDIREKAKDCSLVAIDKALKKGYIPKEYADEARKVLDKAFNMFLHKITSNIKHATREPALNCDMKHLRYFLGLEELAQ